MPVNPPSCHVDVYYSPNVFANKVPIALWRPPADNFNDGRPAVISAGDTSVFTASEAGDKAHDAYIKSWQGFEGFDDEETGAGVGGTPRSPTSPVTPGQGGASPAEGTTPTSAPTPTSLENGNSKYVQYSDLPDSYTPESAIWNKQISKHFLFSAIKHAPIAQNGMSARQIAWNFVLLAQNVLDPMRDRFNFTISSGFRTAAQNSGLAGASKTSEHMAGKAGDCWQGGNRKQAFELFAYCATSGLPIRQLIFEGRWVHVSYSRGEKKNILVWPNPPGQSGKRSFSWSDGKSAIDYARQYS